MDDETRLLIGALRSALKGYITHTASVRTLLAKLDERLEADIQKEEHRHAKDKIRAA